MTKSPLFSAQYRNKFRATVVSDIWPEVLFFTAVACSEYRQVIHGSRMCSLIVHISLVVTLVSELTSTNLGISNQMLTVLGTVSVLSSRSGRPPHTNGTLAPLACHSPLLIHACSFSEGTKLWTNIAIASRNLAQIVRRRFRGSKHLDLIAPSHVSPVLSNGIRPYHCGRYGYTYLLIAKSTRRPGRRRPCSRWSSRRKA